MRINLGECYATLKTVLRGSFQIAWAALVILMIIGFMCGTFDLSDLVRWKYYDHQCKPDDHHQVSADAITACTKAIALTRDRKLGLLYSDIAHPYIVLVKAAVLAQDLDRTKLLEAALFERLPLTNSRTLAEQHLMLAIVYSHAGHPRLADQEYDQDDALTIEDDHQHFASPDNDSLRAVDQLDHAEMLLNAHLDGAKAAGLIAMARDEIAYDIMSDSYDKSLLAYVQSLQCKARGDLQCERKYLAILDETYPQDGDLPGDVPKLSEIEDLRKRLDVPTQDSHS